MQFEDMKTFWDEQNSELLFAIDKTALQKQIEGDTRKTYRRIFIRDTTEVGACFLLAGIYGYKAISVLLESGSHWIETSRYIISIALALFVASTFIIGRRRQTKKEAQFDNTILGELNRMLSQTGYQVWLLKSVFWWYLLPLGTAALLTIQLQFDIINFVISSKEPIEATPFWGYAIMIGIMYSLIYWLNQRAIRKQLLPQQKAYESLKQKLLDAEE